MFIFPNAFKNLRRHFRKSALYFLICVIAVLTLQIYMAGIDRTEKQLNRLPDAIPISADVTSLDGSRFDGLQIVEKTVDGLLNSGHVRDLRIIAALRGGIGNFAPEDYREHLTLDVAGVNTIEALDGLTPEDVTWLEGYNPDVMHGDETVCLMDPGTMSAYGYELGDSVPLYLYYYEYDDTGAITYEPLKLAETSIVGAASMSADRNVIHAAIPLESARASFSGQTTSFRASSATFFVRDALKLNDFKAEMKEIRLSPIFPYGEVAMMVMANQGTALLVNDATFISAATRLQESLSLLRGFLPLLTAVLAAIGYFVSYLMIQTRREEYAVLRLLGLSRRGGMGLYFTEIAVLTLGGSLVGVAISAALGIGSIGAGAVVFALFSICFMLGSVIALLRLGRTNVMLALSQAE